MISLELLVSNAFWFPLFNSLKSDLLMSDVRYQPTVVERLPGI